MRCATRRLFGLSRRRDSWRHSLRALTSSGGTGPRDAARFSSLAVTPLNRSAAIGVVISIMPCLAFAIRGYAAIEIAHHSCVACGIKRRPSRHVIRPRRGVPRYPPIPAPMMGAAGAACRLRRLRGEQLCPARVFPAKACAVPDRPPAAAS